ncbi:MAG: multiheme c-type cytochrome, partial [Myxococcota bacterium]
MASRGFAADYAASRAFLATRPREERPLSVTGFEDVAGIASMSAETCAACHVDIAEEWRRSVHAQAWDDPQFQAEIGKSDNRWLCVNCHTPLVAQQAKLTVGLVDDDVERPRWIDNPRFDAALQREGLNCAGCHVREDGIHGPGLEGGRAPHPVVADARYRADSAD